MTRTQDRSRRPIARRAWIGGASALAIAVATLIVPAGVATQAEAARVQPRTVSPTTTLAVIKTIPVSIVSEPGAVAVNDADDTVYVTHDGPDNVSVINGGTGQLTSTISVGRDPNGVAVDQVDDTVYVTNQSDDSVSVINGRTNTVASSVVVASQPIGVAIDQTDDTVYVANNYGSSVTRINGRTNTPASPLTVGSSPYMVAVNQADDTVYVTRIVSPGKVAVINGRTNTVGTPIDVGTNPKGVAVNQEDDTVYVTNSDDDSVSIINGRTNTVVSTVAVGDAPVGVAVDQADDTVYVTNRDSDNVSVINGRTGQRTDDTITVGDQPLGVTVDDTGTNAGLVYVTNGGSSNTVSVIGRVTPLLQSLNAEVGDSVTISVNVPQVTYDVDDSTVLSVAFGVGNNATNLDDTTGDAWTMTVPAGSGTVDVIVTFRGGLKASAGQFTYGATPTPTPTPTPPPPPPAPTYPPGPPTSVSAVAGDDTALVTWTPPTSTGAGPITSYYVYSTPRVGSCTTTPPATSCVMTGLTNGTTYTFQVQAINIDGASSPSTPSNEVTPGVTPPPPPPPTPTITITGTREDKRIKVTGTATNLTGETLRPWIRFPGQDSFFQGLAVITPKADGTFTWQRITGKKTTVYIAHEDTRSNTVIIPARSRPPR